MGDGGGKPASKSLLVSSCCSNSLLECLSYLIWFNLTIPGLTEAGGGGGGGRPASTACWYPLAALIAFWKS